MRKILAGILIGVSALTFSGCSLTSSQSAAVDVISSAVTAEYLYSNGEIVNYLDNSSLPDKDLDTIIRSLVVIDNERALLSTYKDHPERLIAGLITADSSFVRIKEAYLSIREVVVANKDLYSATQWQSFERFDRAVVVLDQKYNSMKGTISTNETVNVLISIASTAAEVGILL